MNDYEAMFIFDQSMDEEGIKQVLGQIGTEITRLNGTVKSTEMCGRRTFARPMKKREGGHYVRLAIELEPTGVARLLARLKLNEAVFRTQIIRQDVKPVAAAVADVAEEGDGES